jgi:hypothetical protein
MKPIPFNPQKELAPIEFDTKICQLASEIKRLGINWQPHVGCFVWDPDKIIKVDSPFPHRIYFILSLPRFIEIFGSVEAIAAKLVWLPTWHQARLLCEQLGVPGSAVANIWQNPKPPSVDEELQKIYELVIDALQK